MLKLFFALRLGALRRATIHALQGFTI